MLRFVTKNLSYAYRGLAPLFQNVSFELFEGDCLYIQGANGSGKTTLLRVLSGLETPTVGRFFVEEDGVEIEDFFCDYLQTEKNGLFLGLSALENLQFWSSLCEGERLSNERLFDLAKKWGFRTKYSFTKLPVKKFSTGMKKKLALMRVFLLERKILFLDEPFNGLDKKSCDLVLSELLRLKEKKKILVITSHQEVSLNEDLVTHELTL